MCGGSPLNLHVGEILHRRGVSIFNSRSPLCFFSIVILFYGVEFTCRGDYTG